MNRFVLIDGNAIIHRAYHALPPLTAPDGSVVNAVYGFASMLFKLFHDLKPTHMAVAFDRPEPTFRKSMYKKYQAQRPKMEDSLVSQIPKVQDMVRSFGIPIYSAAGFEADDVIGTVCQQITNSNNQIPNKSQVPKSNGSTIEEIVIVTGDRDILQLVDDKRGIQVFMPTKGLSEGKLYGESETKERMGVAPKYIVELKALMGDPSDNYPGVSGIGPKTATDLIEQFGSVEKVYSNINEVKNSSVKEKLIRDKKNAFLSLKLAKVVTTAPVVFDEADAQIKTLDTRGARKKLEEFHFTSLLKRLMAVDRHVDKHHSMPSEKQAKMQQATNEQQQLF